MNKHRQLALLGAAAGAAGTTALNMLTYVDMAARSRPASSTPETTAEKLSEVAHVPISGDEETRENRIAGLGPLTGQLAGVGTSAAPRALPRRRLAARSRCRHRGRYRRCDGRHQRADDRPGGH